MRSPFQILVFPFRYNGIKSEFALFLRSDTHIWQGIAGGGENNETPLQAAIRECYEESGLTEKFEYISLETKSSIPITEFKSAKNWRNDLYFITEYCFGVNALDYTIRISKEHIEYKWCHYRDALQLLHYDGNKTALWELYSRINSLNPLDGIDKN